MEGGKLPIQYIIAKRRLLYLHNILSKKPDELIQKVYFVQRSKPSINDWFLSLQQEREKFQITLSDEEISMLSKNKFKKIISEKINKFAFSSLIEIGERDRV